MHGKTRSFFEDTGIILVLSASLYGGYYLYSSTSNEIVNSTITMPSEEQKIIKIEQDTEDNNTLEIKEIVLENTEKKINSSSLDDNVSEESLPLAEIEPEPEAEIEIEPKMEINKEKNVDLEKLRDFLYNLKSNMASTLIQSDDVNASEAEELKIRITVLKDGSYEELIFISGNKKLFDINQENIVKIFPVHIDEKIKDDFPRYVRISIK